MSLPADGPHFRMFEDYARWASDELAAAMSRRAMGADADPDLAVSDCAWFEDEDGTHHTHCNNAFIFIDGSFAENGFLFCPYCGGHITNHVNETGTDE